VASGGCRGQSLQCSGRYTLGPGEVGTGPSKSWQGPPPKFSLLLTHCDQLILRKISKFDATRLKAKMHTILFLLGFRPRPRSGIQCSPQTLYLHLRGLLQRGGWEKRKGRGQYPKYFALHAPLLQCALVLSILRWWYVCLCLCCVQLNHLTLMELNCARPFLAGALSHMYLLRSNLTTSHAADRDSQQTL